MVNDECYENAAGNMCNSHGTPGGGLPYETDGDARRLA